MFLTYVRAVASTSWGVFFLLAGTVSTACTFVLIYNPRFVLPYWVPAALSILAWLLAPYRLYQQQEKRLHAVTSKPRRAQLVVLDEQGSFFIRCFTPAGSTPRTEIGAYVELHISVENKGDRASTITNYELRIDGIGVWPGLKPAPQSYIWGRNAQHGLDPKSAVASYLEVPAERLADHKKLPFLLPEAVPTAARSLNCTLVIRDTEGNEARVDLTATERD
jgi:hypothetical protein